MTNATLAKLALTLGVAVGGGGFMIYSSVGHAQHYKMVQELVATDLSDWKDKELKVHGKVAASSIVEAVVDQEMQRTFVLEMEGKKIRVFSKGPKPDTFKDQSEVVATGRLVASNDMKVVADGLGIRIASDMPYVVDSSELMAKCPSKYEGAQANRNLDDNKFK